MSACAFLFFFFFCFTKFLAGVSKKIAVKFCEFQENSTKLNKTLSFNLKEDAVISANEGGNFLMRFYSFSVLLCGF